MTEAEFLEGYDPNQFPQVAITVDLALIGVVDAKLCAILQQRSEHPFKGAYALPGGFVGESESIDEAANRILSAKARLDRVWLEQLYTFGDPGRDPRMRIITVAHYALLPADRLLEVCEGADDLLLAPIRTGRSEEGEERACAIASDGSALKLAFDHDAIVDTAISRLRGKLDYAPIAFSLLPREFTLRELQEVHEAIVDRTLAKPAFRRRMIDTGWIAPTGKLETGASFRPAELYTFTPKAGE